jgi:hypothetical protein
MMGLLYRYFTDGLAPRTAVGLFGDPITSMVINLELFTEPTISSPTCRARTDVRCLPKLAESVGIVLPQPTQHVSIRATGWSRATRNQIGLKKYR